MASGQIKVHAVVLGGIGWQTVYGCGAWWWHIVHCYGLVGAIGMEMKDDRWLHVGTGLRFIVCLKNYICSSCSYRL